MNESTEEVSEKVQEGLGAANKKVREGAQNYLDKAGLKIDLHSVEKLIRGNPIASLLLAATAGTMLGMLLSPSRAATLLATANTVS